MLRIPIESLRGFDLAQMKKLRFSTWVLGFFFAILVFSIGIVALGGFNRSFFLKGFWGRNGEMGFSSRVPLRGHGYPPVFAYWIYGTHGENEKILRLLKAVYHPRNRYLLHLDAGSSEHERRQLAISVQSVDVFKDFGNVDVVGKANAVDQMGSSVLSATLHGAAILLKTSGDWDWFITLSASDYPIITQDDLLHVFASLPRNLNFIEHTNDIGWKEYQRINPIVVDPNLYWSTNTQIFSVTERRPTPDAFKIFTGSPWIILSRPFMEYCIKGWDNLPRSLLMYFTNVLLPQEAYFHTVLCNAPEFQNTTVNNDLRYLVWDTPPQLAPIFLNLSHYEGMIGSGAAFARQFKQGDPVLLKVDENILKRHPDGVARGKWCTGPFENRKRKEDPCSRWGDINSVEPGPYGEKFRGLVSDLVVEERLRLAQCNVH